MFCAQRSKRGINRRDWLLRILLDAPLNAFPARNLGLSGRIDAVAMLYCVFPLESSAKRNKKAVQCTADFVLLTHCFVQARQCVLKTKATPSSGFLVALCARDSGGWSDVCGVVQTLKALWLLCCCGLTPHSRWIIVLQTLSSYHPSRRAQHISFE